MKQMTIEDIIARIPEVQSAIAEDMQRKREKVAGDRASLIDQAAEIEGSIQKLEDAVRKQIETTEKARVSFEKSRSELWEIEFELTNKRAQWSNCHQILRRDFGNMDVDAAACRVNGWLQHLINREEILLSKAAEKTAFGPFSRPKFPEATRELEEIRRQISNTRQASRQLEELMTTKGHPEEIAAAAESIVSRVVLDKSN